MKQKFLCALLCLGLCVSPALAAEASFPDVAEDDWFAPYVSVCVEAELMNGTDNGFQPEKVLTNGEAAALAARIREKLTGQAIVFPDPGETAWPWTYPYTSYLEKAIAALGGHEAAAGVVAAPVEPATRSGFMALLALAADGAEKDPLSAINAITALPDTDDADVLRFYNAGILTGTDDYGTFAGEKSLTRAEAAAMVARVVQPELRLPFTPKEAPAPAPAGEDQALERQVALTVNGVPVTAQELASFAVQIAYQLDSRSYSAYGVRLVWDEEVEALIMDQAVDQSAAYIVMVNKAAQLGCRDLTQLAAAMTPSPTQEELAGYVRSADLLCAKHILVADESTAQSIISAMDSQPTLEQFNAILSVLGTDPGMNSNPSGYLFTAGEMVEEFETATRALAVGGYSAQPVQSQFGFHVILRLDPLAHPELTARYQESVMNDFVDAALESAQIQTNKAVLSQIDLKGTYEGYLQALAGQKQ